MQDQRHGGPATGKTSLTFCMLRICCATASCTLPVCVEGCPLLHLCGELHSSACLAPADMKPFTESITRERQQLNSSMETLFPVMLSEWQQHFAIFVQVSTKCVLLSALLAMLYCIAVWDRT